MIDGINEHGHAKDVREKNELLALLVADLARPREEVDRGHPLRRGRLDFSDDGVQVRDHRRHDLPKAFVLLSARLATTISVALCSVNGCIVASLRGSATVPGVIE